MAHPDFETLLNELLPFAQQTLDKQGGFYPFGAAMDRDGKVNYVMAQPDDNENPAPQDVIDLLVDGFRDRVPKDGLKAIGICFDGRVVPPRESTKSDAISFRFEHMSGEAVRVFLPYRKTLSGRVEYGELFATAGSVSVFR